MKGIKTKLLVFLWILIGVICVGAGWISYANSSKALTSNMSKVLPEVAKQTASNVQEKIEGELNSLEFIALREDISNPSNSWENKKDILLNAVKINGNIDMGIIDQNGERRNTDGTIINVKDEKYFLNALSGERNVSDPLVNKANKSITVVYAVPIKYNNEIVGVLTETIDGNKLSELTKQVEFGQTGRAFMIKDDGTTIANSDKELVIQSYNVIENAKKDKKFKSLADIENKMTAKDIGIGEYTYDGFSSFIGYAPVMGTNWSVGVEIEKDEVLSELNILKVSVTLLSIIFAIIGFVIVYILSNIIIKSILKRLELLADDKLSEEVVSKYLNLKNESGDISSSIEVI